MFRLGVVPGHHSCLPPSFRSGLASLSFSTYEHNTVCSAEPTFCNRKAPLFSNFALYGAPTPHTSVLGPTNSVTRSSPSNTSARPLSARVFVARLVVSICHVSSLHILALLQIPHPSWNPPQSHCRVRPISSHDIPNSRLPACMRPMPVPLCKGVPPELRSSFGNLRLF